MATVVGLSDRYANFLVHPLLSGPGVCQICRGTANAGYPSCRQCQQTGNVLGTGVADAVVPVGLALKGEQYANELWRYKNAAGPQQLYFRTGLAAVLWRFIALHEDRVAAHCTVPRFDMVTTAPSTGIGVTDRSMTVRARLHGASLSTGAAVRLCLRGGNGIVRTLEPRAESDGRRFSFTVDYEELAADHGTGGRLWDMCVQAQPTAGAPLIRIGRLFDDMADRKEIFVYPAAAVGGVTVRPYYTVDHDLRGPLRGRDSPEVTTRRPLNASSTRRDGTCSRPFPTAGLSTTVELSTGSDAAAAVGCTVGTS